MEKALTGLVSWLDARLPVTRAWDTHMGKYYAPKNFNLWYFFGVFSLLVLVNQLLTGIWLTMSYTPSAEEAFASVEYIMRDVEYGWLLRYMHSTGASAFFIVVYLHMFRAMMYGSYQKPRELIWIFGMLIFVVLMAEAFVGYVLPWGQMSYWGAQVIISLFGAIPVVGEDITTWIRGDYLLSGITLNRFFALHVVALPIVLLALVVLHIWRYMKWVPIILMASRSKNTRMKMVSRWMASDSILTTQCTIFKVLRSSCSFSAALFSLHQKWAGIS
jgi:ubiquinol-cytochrome c reductase cytochrome b subunit